MADARCLGLPLPKIPIMHGITGLTPVWLIFAATASLILVYVHQIECEQMLRNALAELSPRCRELIRMLFFETPARPYREAARTLGIATGSVGFIRGRCLERLRKHLEKAGFKWK